MIDLALVSLQENANGNLEYSSMMVIKKQFWLVNGRGPLKLRLNHSNRQVALIKCMLSGLKNWGLISAHTVHERTTCHT